MSVKILAVFYLLADMRPRSFAKESPLPEPPYAELEAALVLKSTTDEE